MVGPTCVGLVFSAYWSFTCSVILLKNVSNGSSTSFCISFTLKNASVNFGCNGTTCVNGNNSGSVSSGLQCTNTLSSSGTSATRAK